MIKFYTFRVAIVSAFLILSSFLANAQKSISYKWESLFNGKDLTGWNTFLYPSTAAEDKTPIGLNKDPHGVFKVENGAIHVSGQDWGGVFTLASYSDYHLRFQIKFGEKKWAPRLNVVPDGGLLFHCSPPYDFKSKCWMRSLEYQIQESDIGDYHNVGAGVPLVPFDKGKDGEVEVNVYNPYLPFQTTTRRVHRSGDFENKHGEWTTGELVARGADAVFIVNGFVVNRIFNIYMTETQEQVTNGQLEFQSEGAEHFIKGIEIRRINNEVKPAPKLVSNRPTFELTAGTTQTLEVTNQGEPVELIAAELMGKELEQYTVKLPQFPLTLKKGEKLTIPLSVKEGSHVGDSTKFRLETLAGPVKDFAIGLKIK